MFMRRAGGRARAHCRWVTLAQGLRLSDNARLPKFSNKHMIVYGLRKETSWLFYVHNNFKIQRNLQPSRLLLNLVS
jgi:hypothetical protein